jgi:hypothetical protein
MKYTIFTTLAASLIFSVGALAAPVGDVPETGEIDIHGSVTPVCGVQINGGSEIDFGQDPKAKDLIILDGISVICNVKEGANVGMSSTYGGLRSSDDSDHTVDYSAWFQVLTGKGTRKTAGMICVNGKCGSSNIQTGVKNEFVAGAAHEGGVPAAIDVMLSEDIVFAGDYKDILVLEVAAAAPAK